MSRRSFAGKSVVVTGAGGGLGRAIAKRFAAAGAVIAALDKDPQGLEALRAQLRAEQSECLALRCDVSDPADCEASVANVARHFGRLDVLINNAGISHRSAFEFTRPEVVRRVMEVNFFGAANCTHAALPALLANQGMIIVVSSVAGFAPLIARTGYAASKHALHGFFESLRTEIEPKGVSVLLACPSFISTHIDRNALGGDGGPVTHEQVVFGNRMSPRDAAERIYRGAVANKRLLLIGRAAKVAWWVSRLTPAVFERGMARRLRGELESSKELQ
jgi:NAD(P)-dependent dehydrogenase (short-subunit alcohol dehydrogenase family)